MTYERFLLDTNVLSEFNRRGDPTRWSSSGWRRLIQPLFTRASSHLQKSDSEFELLPPGKHRTQLEEWLDRDLPAWFDGRVLPVNRSFADRWGVLRAQAQMKGRPLAVVDGLLAATALEHGPTIVSRKVADFSAIGLFVVNPWEA